MNNTTVSLLEQFDLVKVLWGVVAFFFIRTLNKIDKNQGLLFHKQEKQREDHNALAKEFSEMKGEHKVFTKNGAHCEVK